ncbi:MAG: outer-membrane lipoprotein carrier protein LolA [Treponema sp.]|nr:outer-membrane lipoprotein carrier protein LolA [Treponema sp.]
MRNYAVRIALSAALCCAGGLFQLYAQEIVTAERYLESVSQVYGGIKDYEARVAIRSGSSDMRGNLSFLSPSFLRIDFTDPAEQVIVFNGDLLTVYLPGQRAVLSQAVARRPGASMASAQGLNLLKRNYIPSFLSGPGPVPLDEGSEEQVIKLRLTRRSVSEGFREIILSVNPESRLIRRIEGRTIAEGTVRFDFAEVRTNLGIPEGRFIYDSPASAFMYNDFLFRDNE